MAIIQLQGEKEKKLGIYYEFDDASRPLGAGGMGKVFRGRRINTNTNEVRDVAIKFMIEGLPPNVIQRARNEAEIHILNDSLVEMMGFMSVETVTPNGLKSIRYHVVSELLIGVSLLDLIKGNVKDQDGHKIPYAEELYALYVSDREKFAVTVMRKVLSGILALHDAGYIHRDIDPSNIMVTRDRKIKLIDFGIAKKIDGLNTGDRNLTLSGQFMGKPHYAAPELVLGELKNQNRPTDIYALGILFYQLLTGNLPFDGPSNVVLQAHMHSKMPLKNIKNKELRQIIGKATDKNCFKRYNSAAEFRAVLDNFTAGGGGGGGMDKRILFGVIGVIVAVGLALILFKWCKEPGPIPPTPPVEEMTVYQKLNNPEMASEGLAQLQEMAANGDNEAKYVLSRLYSKSFGHYTLADTMLSKKRNVSAQLPTDVVKGHEMLEEVIAKNPKDYRALYDLACDYYNYDETDEIQGDLKMCKQLLEKALKYATEKGDVNYIDKINTMLEYY